MERFDDENDVDIYQFKDEGSIDYLSLLKPDPRLRGSGWYDEREELEEEIDDDTERH